MVLLLIYKVTVNSNQNHKIIRKLYKKQFDNLFCMMKQSCYYLGHFHTSIFCAMTGYFFFSYTAYRNPDLSNPVVELNKVKTSTSRAPKKPISLYKGRSVPPCCSPSWFKLPELVNTMLQPPVTK